MNECDSQIECSCTYEPCSRKRKCCECIAYHRSQEELPACYFTPEEEKTYDRSVAFFIRCRQNR
ncbi:MAG: hypothetical protein E3J71_02450 [Candidatus Stahlbacteria bacterium]|nr:MAG: hypothetical protein E3J71_02450 [Candidatus Stahlbacteria bacterium]